MAKPPVSIATQCNCTSLRKASRKISQLYDTMLAPTGVKSTQYAIFAELNRRPTEPPTMHELAQAMVMDRSTLGHNLRPLDRDGLIAITVDEDDRRSRLVKLTPAGQELFQKTTPHWRNAQAQFEKAFGAGTSSDLRTLLHTIAGAQLKGSAAAGPDTASRRRG